MTAHIVLGVNGSGKTTYFKHILNDELKDKDVVFINADEIKIDLVNQGMNSETAKIKSGQIAISKIFECIKNKQAFSLETTLTDDGAMGSIAIIKELKKSGYKIIGYNVFTDDINLNIERVANRFAKNIGHFVPENIIRYRYEKYIENLVQHKDLFDTLNYFNNTNFDFKATNFLDFSNNSLVKEKIGILEIGNIVTQIREINPSYTILSANELNNKFSKRIENREELLDKYLEFLRLELNTVKQKAKEVDRVDEVEIDNSLHV